MSDPLPTALREALTDEVLADAGNAYLTPSKQIAALRDARNVLVAALLPLLTEREQAHAAEVAKLARRIELERNAYDRLAICPAHRGKTNGRCIACQAESNAKAEAREREAQIRADQWQPIETAPKDGTMILLYPSRHWSEDVEPCDCEVGYWHEYDEGWEGLGRAADDYEGPTHWMPLPSPPKEPR